MPADATQQGGEAREKFLHFEGLRQVIVRTGIDPLDTLEPGAASRQNKDRNQAGFLAQASNNG